MKRNNALFLAGTLFAGYELLPIGAGFGKQMRCRRRHRKDRRIFLTFDDGPSAEYTGKLLDLLLSYGIHASFFVVASFAAQNPTLIERMRREGHLICLHSYSHKNHLLMPPAYVRSDFKRSLSILREMNLPVHYFRPPWGHMARTDLREMKEMNLSPVLWDVMAEDWRSHTTAQIIAGKLLRRVKGGSIICLHDGRGRNRAPARTIEALKTVLPVLLENGYTFDTVDHYST